MSEIVTERSGSILRVMFNRPAKKNAMTSSMYVTLADLLNKALVNKLARMAWAVLAKNENYRPPMSAVDIA